MEWYYANAGERIGPIGDDEFNRLTQDGTITSNTLVWNATLPEWRSWGDVSGTGGAAGVTPPTISSSGRPLRRCAECALYFDESDGVVFQNQFVCTTCKPVYFSRVRQGVALPAQLRYAGFWIRCGAKILDGFILGIPMMIVSFVVMAIVGVSVGQFDGSEPTDAQVGALVGVQLLMYVFQIGARVAYDVFFLGRYGATPGKMILGLKVVKPDGSPLTYLHALGRFGAEMINGFTCGIGYIIAGFDSEKRGLHDHIAGTRVVFSDGRR